MLEVSHLSKDYGPFHAVQDISFNARAGEVLGFLGPNGAGKSTKMKMITGFLAQSSGSATVCGADVTRDPIANASQDPTPTFATTCRAPRRARST